MKGGSSLSQNFEKEDRKFHLTVTVVFIVHLIVDKLAIGCPLKFKKHVQHVEKKLAKL